MPKRVAFVVDGETVHGALHEPPGKRTDPIPLVILVHGMASSRTEFFEFPDRLAAGGYAVLAIDFRGHGESEGQRGVLSKGRALRDIEGALQAARGEYKVDADRWALLGHSLGGALAIGAAPYLPTLACLVALAPVWRLRAEMNPFEYVGYNVLRAVNGPLRLVHKPGLYVPYRVDYRRIYSDPRAIERGRKAGFLQRTIPVQNYRSLVGELDAAESARAVQVPTLVLVAQYDIVVGKYNSRRVFEALAGPKHWGEIPRSGHSMCGDANSETVTKRVLAFLNQHLQGAEA